MYTELIEYIYSYCSGFMNELERKAASHYEAHVRWEQNPNHPSYQKMFAKNLSNDPKVTELLKDGHFTFRMNTAERIYRDHKNELNLNLCPNCGQIARTPKARQCRFCWHDWH